jgi:hypothetical protein
MAHLLAAYELGIEASSPALAGTAAAALDNGGADTNRDEWLRLAGESAARLANSTLWATYELARADSLMERGDMQAALDAAVNAACNPGVTPTVRYLGLGRSLQVALLRRDLGMDERLSEVSKKLARVWPAGGAWHTSTWSVYGDLLRLRSALLHGETPQPFDPEKLRYLTRSAVTPSVVRTVCRAAIDRGERVDAAAAAHGSVPAATGSLMGASVTSLDAANAAVQGDDALADSLWKAVLNVSAANGYLVLVSDALEALGCIASRRTDTTKAAYLILAARDCRQEAGYHHRFKRPSSAPDPETPGWRSCAFVCRSCRAGPVSR